jgi:methylated-DNA-protein-cysteine methyltransferase-like protein
MNQQREGLRGNQNGLPKIQKLQTKLSQSKKAQAKSSSERIHERIRRAIRMVPHGKVATYGSVARAAGHARAARLVAHILNDSEGLPWQRILGSGGEIKLPGEAGMEQRFRLQMEGVRFRGRRVDMKLHEHHFTTSPQNKATRSSPAQARSKRARNR